jgi:polyhydroxyalkanoate synthase subunit PhaC
MATTANGSWQQAEATAGSLGPEENVVLSAADPLRFGSALSQVGLGLARNPAGALGAWSRWAGGVALACAATAARTFGADATGPAEPARKDRRFADPAWRENPAYFLLMQQYLLAGRLVADLVEAAGLDEQTELKADLAATQIVDALAPTNTPLNPAVLKRTLETGGLSLLRGFRTFLADLADNGGLPQQVDRRPFTIGKNLAATPGKVVLRNDLMELLQYEPQTETVFEVPLLCSPPWINKYYVMDLAPRRSFVEWAVQHGHTVFAISYRNPDATMRGVELDDYLLHGPQAALEAIEEITGSTATNIVGLCLGGTLTTMLLAWLAENEPERVGSATLLNTIVDFSRAGVLRAFTDDASIAAVERQMAERGFLEGRDMASTFTMLRANDLIWGYVVNNWLLGNDPPAFDILAWNADDTRMPAAMHSFYLRSCYQRNDFAHGRLALAGKALDPAAIASDVYILNAVEDHIAPWRTGYESTRVLAQADTRFVLSSAGHIAGIVNPPSPKSSYWTNDDTTPEADAWLARATEHQGSWWEDWASWIAERAGGQRTPPPTGSAAHPPLGDAPGAYVHST